MPPEDVAANLLAEGVSGDFPDGWVFDGTRRLYDHGQPTEGWTARAVDVNEPFGSDRKVLIAEANTPMEAVEALVRLMRSEGS